MELRRGDLIEVYWADIYEDVTGNPDNAGLAARISVGYFWDVGKSQGLRCLVTSTTKDNESSDQSGWCCYPFGTILRIKRIRKTRRKNVEASCVWEESSNPDLRVSDDGRTPVPYVTDRESEPAGAGERGDAEKAG